MAHLTERLTADDHALSGSNLGPEFILDRLHRITFLVLKALQGLQVICQHGAVGADGKPVALGQEEPRHFCSAPLGGDNLTFEKEEETRKIDPRHV